MPSLYLETITAAGDVALARREADATLDVWQKKLAATDEGSPEQFRAVNRWIIDTVYRDVKRAITVTDSPSDAIGATKLPQEVLKGIAERGDSPRDAITKALKEWLGVQYRDGAVDLAKTLDLILRTAMHADELTKIEANRKQLRAQYTLLIAKTRSNLALFEERANRLRESTRQIDAYGEAIDRTLGTDCRWAVDQPGSGQQQQTPNTAVPDTGTKPLKVCKGAIALCD